MLVKSSELCINLDRFDYIRVCGYLVEAVDASRTIIIAKCTTKKGAIALQQAISDAWLRTEPSFDVIQWCDKHNITLYT